MPIPDAVAGKEQGTIDPIDKAADQIREIANAALRGDITLDEWEIMADQVAAQFKK